jgi:hypothetical protein
MAVASGTNYLTENRCGVVYHRRLNEGGVCHLGYPNWDSWVVQLSSRPADFQPLATPLVASTH